MTEQVSTLGARRHHGTRVTRAADPDTGPRLCLGRARLNIEILSYIFCEASQSIDVDKWYLHTNAYFTNFLQPFTIIPPPSHDYIITGQG